ncbi:ParA family protein [Vibrio fluvialis]|uniref:ParA family protein n=1 Tax=Vibrio fluvialis TaxID=676 RepID=UPI00192C776C|nr:ParA family protein [Vibrio fluvialis]MBL4262839.1 ParA family protein [Vibrio fluvialis]
MAGITALKPALVNPLKRKSKCIGHPNEKGGVGKTTTEYNQAYRLAEQGKRVLIIDFDGQRNMSRTCLGSAEAVVLAERGFTSADLFNPATVIDDVRVLTTPVHDNIHLIPAHKAKIADIMSSGKEFAKQLILKPKELIYQLDYDYILIDTPPSLGITQLSALATIDYAFIPVAIDDFSNEGLKSLLHTIMGIKQSLNAQVELAGIYVNFYEKPTNRIGENPALDIENELKREYKNFLIDKYIPRSLSIKEARMKGVAAWVKAPNGNAAVVGRRTREVIDLINARIK